MRAISGLVSDLGGALPCEFGRSKLRKEACATTIWKWHRFEGLSLGAGDLAVEAALDLVDTLVSSKETYGEAFLLARTAHRFVYDMFYLALARREDAVFLTLDKALRKEAEHQGVRVA